MAVSPLAFSEGKPSSIQVIAFDGFVIFDPRWVATRAEEVFPTRGAELVNEWRTRQFEYSWIRTSAQQYVDFWQVTEEALLYAAKKLKLDLTEDSRKKLMNSYLELKPWPDVAEGLKQLRQKNIRLAFLSNFTARMLDANLANSGLRDFFEDHLTTDRVRAFKPSPLAYKMGIDSFKLARNKIAFAAFGAWDAAGAKWFGYPTVWLNRGNVPIEELGVTPDVVGKGIADLVNFVS
jgi:2-haloacid dehalogenase